MTGATVRVLGPSVARRTARRLVPSRRSTRRRLLRLAEQVGVLAVAFALWQLITTRADDFFFPPPTEIFQRVYENWFSGPASSLFVTEAFGADVVPSLSRMLTGWGIAAGLGIALGTLLGLTRRLPEYVEPIVHFLRSTPGPALLPVFLLLFGLGSGTKIAFIAFGSVWPILLNTIDGVRAVDVRYLDTAAVFRASRSRRVLTIVLPSAAPRIVAGLRISLAIALVLMVISDMINSSTGFGYALIEAQRSFRVLDVWAGIVLLGAIGFLLNWLFVLGERRLLAWHRGFRGRLEE